MFPLWKEETLHHQYRKQTMVFGKQSRKHVGNGPPVQVRYHSLLFALSIFFLSLQAYDRPIPKASAISLGLSIPSSSSALTRSSFVCSSGFHIQVNRPFRSSSLTSIGPTSSPFTDRHFVNFSSKWQPSRGS